VRLSPHTVQVITKFISRKDKPVQWLLQGFVR